MTLVQHSWTLHRLAPYKFLNRIWTWRSLTVDDCGTTDGYITAVH